MVYRVKDAKYVNGLFILAITVEGNGEGLKNGILLEDEYGNEFYLKEVAMTCGNMKDTTITVHLSKKVLSINEIGKELHIKEN